MLLKHLLQVLNTCLAVRWNNYSIVFAHKFSICFRGMGTLPMQLLQMLNMCVTVIWSNYSIAFAYVFSICFRGMGTLPMQLLQMLNMLHIRTYIYIYIL